MRAEFDRSAPSCDVAKNPISSSAIRSAGLSCAWILPAHSISVWQRVSSTERLPAPVQICRCLGATPPPNPESNHTHHDMCQRSLCRTSSPKRHGSCTTGRSPAPWTSCASRADISKTRVAHWAPRTWHRRSPLKIKSAESTEVRNPHINRSAAVRSLDSVEIVDDRTRAFSCRL